MTPEMKKALLRAAKQTAMLRPLAASIERWSFTRRLARWSGDDQRRLEFYKQFVGPNDTVFDVGANVGNRTKVFARLASKVIAVEPQPFCQEVLERGFRGDARIQLVAKALGSRVGRSQMHIGEAHVLSSLSEKWISATQKSGRFAAHKWGREIDVEVTTLDELMATHGVPGFIKIDVEGFELQVLMGLSRPVRFLSFEVTPELPDMTWACIRQLTGICASARFRFSEGETMRWTHGEWMTADEMREVVGTIPDRSFGDLYAWMA